MWIFDIFCDRSHFWAVGACQKCEIFVRENVFRSDDRWLKRYTQGAPLLLSLWWILNWQYSITTGARSMYRNLVRVLVRIHLASGLLGTLSTCEEREIRSDTIGEKTGVTRWFDSSGFQPAMTGSDVHALQLMCHHYSLRTRHPWFSCSCNRWQIRFHSNQMNWYRTSLS